MQKVDARSISSSAQGHLRQLAVKAVLDGKKQKQVAKLFGVTPQTICVWVKAYRLQGQEALKSKGKGRPKGGKLKPWQAAQIAKTVIDHHPEQLKLPFYLWTREAVALLIKRRFGCNMLSAITNQGRLNFMVFKGRFTAQVFLEFLRRLLRQSDRRVYLIIDRHPVHRSLKVKNWVKENEERIQLFFLPSYSPEINPDELLNQDVKSNALGRQRPANQTELMGKVRG
jgi:transposase